MIDATRFVRNVAAVLALQPRSFVASRTILLELALLAVLAYPVVAEAVTAEASFLRWIAIAFAGYAGLAASILTRAHDRGADQRAMFAFLVAVLGGTCLAWFADSVVVDAAIVVYVAAAIVIQRPAQRRSE